MKMLLKNLSKFVFYSICFSFVPWLCAKPYQVGVGDVIHVQVISEIEFSGYFTVNPEGYIDYPFIHKIAVTGLDIEKVDELITSMLRKGYLKDPQVSVSVKEYQSQRVLVFGSIAKPGRYVLSEETRVLDLISLAGGLSGAGGKRVLLFRPKKAEIPLKEIQSTTPAILSPPPTSQPSIPQTQIPNFVDEKNGLVEQLPAMVPTVIDYFDLVNNGKMDQNIVLKDGDILNVPKANEVLVIGNVGKPGPLKYEDRMTLLQAVTLSGGPTTTASTKGTYVLRHGPKGEQKIAVRLDRILESKAPNFTLEADDVVVIPESFF